MKKLSKEMQMVYDFCYKREKQSEKCAESVDDFTAQMSFTSSGTAYWEVRQFIEVNFMEE